MDLYDQKKLKLQAIEIINIKDFRLSYITYGIIDLFFINSQIDVTTSKN